MTMPSVCPDQTTHCSPIFDQIELVAVIIFTIEYMLRWYASPEAFPVGFCDGFQALLLPKRILTVPIPLG